MNEATDTQKLLIEQSTRAIQDIDELLRNEAFQRFMEKFKALADELANEVLHGEMPADERENKRQFRLGILEVLGSPLADREGHARILAGLGVRG